MDPFASETATLLGRLKSFLIPGGEDAMRGIHRMRLQEQGQIRSGPQARWSPFTAEETVEARRSGFVWEARIRTAKVMTVHITDGYENGHGWAMAKVAGVSVKSGKGPEYDKGQVQRYLASLTPPALVNHPHLAWTAIAPDILQVRDATDPRGTSVDFVIDEEGRPVEMRAQRPMTVGKTTVMTPWSALGTLHREWNGMRMPTVREAVWHIPGGSYTYFHGEVTDISAE
jgi:hypothetical protein